MRTVSLASSQSCCSVDSDAWCKWGLTEKLCHRLRQINYTLNINGTHGGVEVRIVLLAEERDLLDPVQRGVILTVGAVRTVRAGLDAVATHPVKVLITSVKLKQRSSLIDVHIDITIVRNLFETGKNSAFVWNTSPSGGSI